MVTYVGQGDPTASMRLLWLGAVAAGHVGDEPAGKRGPKAGLTLDAIVSAAIAVADESGIDAVSMRGVGERLGRTSMALYTYVPGKAELVDLMWDRALGELAADYDLTGGWRPALRALAVDLWQFYERHPWALEVSGARPCLGPNEMRHQEAAAAILDGCGLSARDITRTFSAIYRYTYGTARVLVETRQAGAVTGVSEDDWWLARSAMFDEVCPDFAQRFPVLTRLEAAGAYDAVSDGEPYLEAEASDTFSFGLDRLLDGVTSHLTGRS